MPNAAVIIHVFSRGFLENLRCPAASFSQITWSSVQSQGMLKIYAFKKKGLTFDRAENTMDNNEREIYFVGVSDNLENRRQQ